MDDAQFIARTRRAMGRVVGGAAAAMFAVRALGDAEAAPKERCQKVSKACGGQKTCCSGLTCGRNVNRDGRYCCRKPNKPCRDSNDCCKPALCTDNTCQVIE